jgi:hypothetical protein
VPQRAVAVARRALVGARGVAPVLEQAAAEGQHVPGVEAEEHTGVAAPEAVGVVVYRETSVAGVQHTDHPRLTTRWVVDVVSEV